MQKAINTKPVLSFTFCWQYAFLLAKEDAKDLRSCKGLAVGSLVESSLIQSVKSSSCHLKSHHCISSNAFSYQSNRTSCNERNVKLKQWITFYTA